METLFKNKTKTTMETEKLTVKDCMLYPNAKVQEFENEMPFKKCSDWENILDFLGNKITTTPYQNIDRLIEHCKLQLRPIESLTEEEKEILINLYTDGLEILKQEGTRHFQASQKVVDYLRSINIDIDGFIASGKAVAE